MGQACGIQLVGFVLVGSSLALWAVNLAVSPLQHGLACGERISCGLIRAVGEA